MSDSWWDDLEPVKAAKEKGFNVSILESDDFVSIIVMKPGGGQMLYARVYDAHIIQFILSAFLVGHYEVTQ